MTVRSFNKTGERFANEGEYSPEDIANDPARFVKPTVFPTTGGPITIDTCTPALPYASQENNNKFFDTPGDVFQRHFFQRKPIDAGSVKILSNNISHLVYQQCRTLAVLNGPGTIGYKDSDRALTTFVAPATQTIVQNPFIGWSDDSARNWFREIGWSQYSSRRLGPFFGINDRKIEYNDDALNSVNLTNNASCIRKMILVIRGNKVKIPAAPVGIYPDDARFHIHVVVTSDGGNPTDPATNIIPLFGQQRAYITECNGAAVPTARVEGPLPCPVNSDNRNDLFSGVPAYSVNLDWPSQANTTLEAPDAVKTYDVFTGHFSAFIPIDCVGDITTTNASYLGTNVFQYYVHVGWLVGQPTMAISSITLLEVRDPGSAEAS